MTAKVDQWIWYLNNRTQQIGKLKLKSFLNKVNDDPYFHRVAKRFFPTKQLAQQHKEKENGRAKPIAFPSAR